MPDSDRYKTDSNLRQILLILCTYTLPTPEHSAPLELFLQSLAVAIFIQQNQLFSVLQFGARIGFILIDIVFYGRFRPISNQYRMQHENWRCLYFLGWEPQTDTKPIAICGEILPFLCTYTLPHMHVQLRLNFSSRALLKRCCASCSKINCFQFCSLGPELIFRICRPSTFPQTELAMRGSNGFVKGP